MTTTSRSLRTSRRANYPAAPADYRSSLVETIAGSAHFLGLLNSAQPDNSLPPGVLEVLRLLYKVRSCQERYRKRLVQLSAEAKIISAVRASPIHHRHLQEAEEVVRLFGTYGYWLVQVIRREKYLEETMMTKIKEALLVHEVEGLGTCDIQRPGMIGTCRL